MYVIICMLMIHKYISNLIVQISASQHSILFLVLYKRGCLKNINLPSNLKLDQTDINLSKKLRNLGVAFDENLNLKHQIAGVKMKAIVGLIYNAKKLKFIDTESKA